jgi:hypothetical protein
LELLHGMITSVQFAAAATGGAFAGPAGAR